VVHIKADGSEAVEAISACIDLKVPVIVAVNELHEEDAKQKVSGNSRFWQLRLDQSACSRTGRSHAIRPINVEASGARV
jgi:hypothetical protein